MLLLTEEDAWCERLGECADIPRHRRQRKSQFTVLRQWSATHASPKTAPPPPALTVWSLPRVCTTDRIKAPVAVGRGGARLWTLLTLAYGRTRTRSTWTLTLRNPSRGSDCQPEPLEAAASAQMVIHLHENAGQGSHDGADRCDAYLEAYVAPAADATKTGLHFPAAPAIEVLVRLRRPARHWLLCSFEEHPNHPPGASRSTPAYGG